jgi:photosystem II stability/assembly factor-like uncharacterized protein
MARSPRILWLVSFGAASWMSLAAAQQPARPPISQAPTTALARASTQQATGPFRELRFRAIGPAVMGGRLHDVTALPNDPSTVIIATATGGLWKSSNRGTTWTPIFEGQSTATFGVIAMAPSDPNILWAGTGEQNNRQSSSWGDGVYRSTDGGTTWSHVGLEDSRAIGRIVVDPKDPGVAYVAALGNLWAPSEMRGVFKTIDAGRTWAQTLRIDTYTGAVDLVMDPHDSRVLYAAAYARLRQPCCFNGGAPTGGIYKSTDAGTTWQRLTNGLPPGDNGRVGLAIAQRTPGLIYAIVENATAPGIYRSTDGGENWTRMNRLDDRPSYYSAIYVDPTNDERLYSLARWFYKSEDAGKTWRQMPTEPTYDVGLKGDYHAMWIDPADSRHFYLAGDGGLFQSWDRGETYSRINNLPIGQFYGVGLDDDSPYNLYGGMQDNHSWVGPSATRHYLGIVDGDWHEIGFNDGLQHHVDLAGKQFVYSNAVDGDLTLVDGTNGDRRNIRPQPAAGEPPYRFEWMSPGLASRHVPGTYYYGGQYLFITRDRGATWEKTKDLTRALDRNAIAVMGVPDSQVTLSRNDGQTAFSAISAIDESPLSAQVLWVGTDDGNVQVSRDGGKTWTEVRQHVGGAPDGSYISRISASSASPGTAYLAVDNHRRGDWAPYGYRTEDFGKTWTAVTNGLPQDGCVRFIGEYSRRPGTVFLGTEHALYISTDSGTHWDRLGANLPTTLYMDVEVQPRTQDVVVATHGRSLYILDQGSTLTEWSAATASEAAHLYSIRPANIWQYWEDYSYRGQDFFTGENPPDGAIIDYSLSKDAPDVQITIANAAGRVVRTLSGPGGAGVVHRVFWNLRHEPPPSGGASAPAAGGEEGGGGPTKAMPVLPRPATPQGPWVSPGAYTVTLHAGDARATRTVEVRGDPGKPAITLAQYKDREVFLLDVADLQRKAAQLATQSNPAAELRRVIQRLNTLAADFNGSGSRPGTLYGPTAGQRRMLEELRKTLISAPGSKP